MSAGYIPINRKIFDHDFWKEAREYSKFEAWLDLIQTARFDKEEISQWLSGKFIKYGRGQLPASVRFLKERWGWGSNTKVEQFLKQLETRSMIKTDKGQGQTVITICNYDTYNISKESEKTGKGQRQGRKQGQKQDESNKDNKEINNLFIEPGLSLEEKELIDISEENRVRWGKFKDWFEGYGFKKITSIEDQLTPKQLVKLFEHYGASDIKDTLERLENYKGSTKYTSVYLTLNNWLKRETAA